MSLVPDYSNSSSSCSSSSDSEDQQRDEQQQIVKIIPEKFVLPSANTLFLNEKPGEVFNNPYKEAENAKIASLERHVKMVDNDTNLKLKNAKKICWNNRKGRCRFGSNCTYAHDSDLQLKKITSVTTALNENGSNEDTVNVSRAPSASATTSSLAAAALVTKQSNVIPSCESSSSKMKLKNSNNNILNNSDNSNKDCSNNDNAMNNFVIHNSITGDLNDDLSSNSNKISNNTDKRKKHPGLGDSIIPSKKVMKQYKRSYNK